MPLACLLPSSKPAPTFAFFAGRSAFTLFELVAVISILGILGATGLSRFVDLTQSARAAEAKGVREAFRAGVDLAHATWVARGANASLNAVSLEGGITIGVNDAGWPENALAAGGDGAVSSAECIALWNGLMSSAPGISATAGAAEWLASVEGSDTCRYAYPASPGYHFRYASHSGSIVESDAGGSGAGDDAADDAAEAAGGGGGGAPACGLLGIEPLLVLAWVRRRRTPRR